MDADVVVENKVERELLIAARPETVWSLLTDPLEAVRWMGVSAHFDVRPGGEYRVEVLPGEVASGAFVEIDRPRRLVYTWGWESEKVAVPPGSSTIVFELEPRGAGTLLRFTHRDLPNADSAAKHGHGWQHYLDRLVAASSGDAGVDPWVKGHDC